VTSTNEDQVQLLKAHREMYGAMLAARTDRLCVLLADQYTLTHMTGRVQSKTEWLKAIESGAMRYHAAEEKSVTVAVTGDTALLVGRSVVTATIFGSHGTWNLQLTTSYARRDGKWLALRTAATTFVSARFGPPTAVGAVARQA
jgi:hypothetical protein